MRPDRWTQHAPRCGANELPEGAPCRCPAGWPRTAAYWQGITAIGRKHVEALIKRWKQGESEKTV